MVDLNSLAELEFVVSLYSVYKITRLYYRRNLTEFKTLYIIILQNYSLEYNMDVY